MVLFWKVDQLASNAFLSQQFSINRFYASQTVSRIRIPPTVLLNLIEEANSLITSAMLFSVASLLEMLVGGN
jgi:chromosome condensin MukBEF MukE localization factor